MLNPLGGELSSDMPIESYPIGSMYGIFTYICHKFKPNVGIYIYTYMDGMSWGYLDVGQAIVLTPDECQAVFSALGVHNRKVVKHNKSGQIIATSHDRFPPNGGLVREIPLFQGSLGWWNILIWPDKYRNWPPQNERDKGPGVLINLG